MQLLRNRVLCERGSVAFIPASRFSTETVVSFQPVCIISVLFKFVISIIFVLLGWAESHEDLQQSEEESEEDEPEEAVLEEEEVSPWDTMFRHVPSVADDLRKRIIECAHPRWYDLLFHLAHKLSVK